ncbi:MAG: hypothetical protein CMG25_04480 [Candidatus Marinimicrobia bacterium]|nr:hypothetical protein [Candidatus Neomarinimicrobiota bacterium]
MLSFDLIILLIVFAMLVTFFIFEVFALEVTAMAATAILLLFNVISVDDALSGFSNKAVITIGAMFILSRSLVKTGFLEVFADFMYTHVGKNKWVTIATFLLIVSILSGLINNTAAVAIFIPLAINLCQKFHISPTRVLLPLSYAAIFGGTLTLIGTSTNLIISDFIEQQGLTPFSIFEFTKVGSIFMVVGIVYNLIIACFFLPSRAIVSSLTQKYHMNKYLTEFSVKEDSILIGKNIGDLDLSEKYEIDIIKLLRKDKTISVNLDSHTIRHGDVFLVQINVKNIIKFKNEMNVSLLSEVKMNQEELEGKNHVLVEALVTQQSSLIGRTLYQFNFRTKLSSFVLAIKRQNELLREKVAHIKLKFSDTLLILVPRNKINKLKSSLDFVVLEELDLHLRYERFWWISVIVIPIIMLLSSIEFISITKGAIFAVVIILALRALSIQEAYQSINWTVIFLLAALVPISVAIRNTGADQLLGDLIIQIANFLSGFSSSTYMVYLSLLYSVTFILSAFMSNAAVAIILAPIGIYLAAQLNIDPRPFLIAICFGASNSFMTPIGYQTNLMVYGPGEYKMKDFIIMGLPLTIIFWFIAMKLIPIYWPFISV